MFTFLQSLSSLLENDDLVSNEGNATHKHRMVSVAHVCCNTILRDGCVPYRIVSVCVYDFIRGIVYIFQCNIWLAVYCICFEISNLRIRMFMRLCVCVYRVACSDARGKQRMCICGQVMAVHIHVCVNANTRTRTNIRTLWSLALTRITASSEDGLEDTRHNYRRKTLLLVHDFGLVFP